MTLRDAFVALFFVTVGTLINPRAVLSNPGMLLAILAMVVVGKFVVWTAVVKLFGYRLKTAVLVGTGLTQIGEFSFVLVQVAHANGLVPDEFYYATMAASLLSIAECEPGAVGAEVGGADGRMRTGCEAGRGRGGRTTGGAWDNRADTPKGLLLNQIERNSKLVVALVVWLLTPSSQL